MIIKTENIKKSYNTPGDKNEVLREIDYCIEEGKIHCIIGPSGSGKSTLLHVLGTLDSFDSGKMYLFGQDISQIKNKEKFRSENIGFVFQFHHLLHEFNVIENLIIPQLLLNKDKIKAKNISENLLKKLGMDHLKNRHPSQISGGEKQRVAVLRAIVNSPGIILADEPTGNLDRKNSQKVLDLLEQIKANYHSSIIIATHDDSIMEMADKCFLITKGSLKEL